MLTDLAEGAASTGSALHATAHLGAHADAPGHVLPGAPPIDERPLDLYVGPCQVIRVATGLAESIRPDALRVPLEAERLLLATGTYPDPRRFNDDFAAPSVELIDHLHDRGVRLLGVDTPSVDLFAAEDLPVHRRMIRHDMAILEGLVLDRVPEGLYELIALPLRLVGFDASPVRAILRSR